MKQSLTLLLIILGLSACQNPFGGTKETFNSDYAIKDTASIDKIVITDSRAITLNLEKVNGKWLADGRHEIREDFKDVVLTTLYRMQKKHPVPKNMREDVMKRMNTMAKKVEVYAGDKKIREMYASSAPSSDDASYMYLKGDDMPYVVAVPGVVGTLDARFNAEFEEWKSHEIFKYRLGEIKSIRVEYPLEGLASYTLHQPSNDQFEIERGGQKQKVNKLKALAFYNAFSNINLEAFQNDFSKRDSIEASTPHAIIEVTDKQNEARKITIFRMPTYRRSKMMFDEQGNPVPYDLDRYFATVRQGKEFVIIQQYVFEKLFRKYEDFID